MQASTGVTPPQTPFDGGGGSGSIVPAAEPQPEPIVRPPFIAVPPEVEELMAKHLEFLSTQGATLG